ncbi:hypothetical protein VPNG_09785 [Cytospora leucostoma]|uniref:DUF1993 domain-containing protein n=1 Tax=Cytospora leucostoma TaxID=1230097 RepID=A0A423VGT9_9PEZI|nr:hypothetical protein VPNG_09785 [Cytospora leucostoma]
MTGYTFYDAYFPTIIKIFKTFEVVLTKAQVHAKENGIDVNTAYAPARLYEDMRPLTYQVHVASSQVRAVLRSLTDVAIEEPKQDLTTFDHLFASIKETRERLESVVPEDINGKEDQEKEFEFNSMILKFVSRDCITGFVLPNLFFHLTTAYDILRHNGVPLGKRDYLQSFAKW